MPTHTELLEIISNGEDSGVEFKRDVVANHDLAKELVAFSNLGGGMVLLGVEDDGNILAGISVFASWPPSIVHPNRLHRNRFSHLLHPERLRPPVPAPHSPRAGPGTRRKGSVEPPVSPLLQASPRRQRPLERPRPS
jgi:hypothetical protein